MKLISKLSLLIAVSFFSIILNSCSKRSHPSKTATVTPISGISSGETKREEVKKTDSVAIRKAIIKRKQKPEFPKVIAVNDSAASKSVDGRYYYDVMGHRYWRNNKDGKYYLFNKSMYNNDDFKPKK